MEVGLRALGPAHSLASFLAEDGPGRASCCLGDEVPRPGDKGPRQAWGTQSRGGL